MLKRFTASLQPNTFEQAQEALFKTLFDTYKSRVYAYTLSIAHSAYAAEEITQEIFIKLWLCRDALESISNHEAYIFTIARNKTLNYLRNAATQTSVLAALQSQMHAAVNNTEDKAALTELEQLVNEALNSLSPQRRLVYQLSRQKGLDHEQIATQLQLSRNTVKNHLVFTLKFIRQYLDKHGVISLLIGWWLIR